MSASITARSVLSAFEQVTPLAGGRNSEVYRVDERGETVVIKFFSGKQAVERFEREVASYQFLAELPTQWTPSLLAYDPERLYLKLNYIAHDNEDLCDGMKIDTILGQVFRFFEDTLSKSVTENLRPAEACALNFEGFLKALNQRFEALMAVNDPRLKRLLLWIHEQMAQLWRLSSQKTLPLALQRWIPADFSLHNVLYQKLEKRAFIVDFEYAGRDDPARLLADWVWHPGQVLSSSQQQRIEHFFEQLFAQDPSFKQRYVFLKMGCGLRWLLILLNVFLPSYRQQRPWLNQKLGASWSALEAQQLKKAEQLKLKLTIQQTL